MATLNVYVPQEMKKQMLLRSDLNWSAIAQEAFAAALRTPDRDWVRIASPYRAEHRCQEEI